MKKKIIIYFVIIFIILNFTHAQNLCGTNDNPCRDNWDNFDYANKNADISKIPPDKVDITEVIAHGRGSELTPDQIAVNFDRIQDLTQDVDKSKAQVAIQKSYGIITDLGKGANLKNGVLSATYGNKDYVPLPQVSKTTLVEIDENGNVLLREEKKPPKEGSYTAIYSETTSIETPDEKQVSVDGRLSYKNAQAYVKAGDKVTIQGVEIQSAKNILGKEYKQDIIVFFDGNEHPEVASDYVSLDLSRERMFAYVDSKSAMNLRFEKSNPFLKIEEGDKVEIDLGINNKMFIQNRDELNLIPSVNVRQTDEESWIQIVSGQILLTSEGRRVSTSVFALGGAGSPLSITIEDQNGNNLIGTESEPKKFIISNYNEIADIPLTAEEGLAQTLENYDYAPAKVSERLYYNYEEFTPDSFKRKFPDIGIEFIGGAENLVAIKRISDTLDHLPPRVRDSIKGFVIFSDKEFQLTSSGKYSAWTSSDRIIRLKSSDLTEATIYHEAAHTLTFQLRQEADEEKSRLKIQEYNKLENEIKQLARRYDIEIFNLDISDSGYSYSTKIGTDTTLFSKEVDQIRKRWEEIAALTVPSFASEWNSISGDVYGKDIVTKEEDGKIFYSWSDGSNMPKKGCVRAYGCKDFWDDVATYLENVYRNPEFYQPLIDQKSPIYDKRYIDKINLLPKYGFIDTESHKRITTITGQNKGDYYEIKRKDGNVYRYFYANGLIVVESK